MKELQTQIRDACPKCKQWFGRFFLPYGDESIETAKEYKPNQIVRNKVIGVRKQRSLIQLNLYWATCGYVGMNMEHKRWDTKKKVDFGCRVELDFRDHDVIAIRPDGEIAFKYMSIAVPNLPHIEACNYFGRAFDVMGGVIGMDVEDMIQAAKNEMQSY